MKEVESLNLHQDIGIVKQAEQQKKIKIIGSTMRQKGLTLFKINTDTFEVSKSELESYSVLGPDKKFHSRIRVKYEEGHVYAQAINKYVALEKAKKHLKKQSQSTVNNGK